MNHEARRFRCDDAAGYDFQVLRAGDGDFHLSIVPNIDDLAHEEGVSKEEAVEVARLSGSVRIRMPMIGGGAHSNLWHMLAQLWQPGTAVVLTEKEARWLYERHVYWDDGPFGLREKLVGLFRRRRPNPKLESVGTLGQFMADLERSIRGGGTVGRYQCDIMNEFAERFRTSKLRPFEEFEHQAPIVGRTAEVVTIDEAAHVERAAQVASGEPSTNSAFGGPEV